MTDAFGGRRVVKAEEGGEGDSEDHRAEADQPQLRRRRQAADAVAQGDGKAPGRCRAGEQGLAPGAGLRPAGRAGGPAVRRGARNQSVKTEGDQGHFGQPFSGRGEQDSARGGGYRMLRVPGAAGGFGDAPDDAGRGASGAGYLMTALSWSWPGV